MKVTKKFISHILLVFSTLSLFHWKSAIAQPQPFEIKLNTGWNLVSFPFADAQINCKESDCCFLYPYVYHFNSSTSKRMKFDLRVNYPTGLGFYLYSFHNCTLRINGSKAYKPSEIDLKKGSNLIAVPYGGINLSALTGCNISFIRYYNSSDRKWYQWKIEKEDVVQLTYNSSAKKWMEIGRFKSFLLPAGIGIFIKVQDDCKLSLGKLSLGVTCSRFNPLISIIPSSQTGSPGQTLTYTITVTNRDSEYCSSTVFMLSVDSLPPSWSYQFDRYPGFNLAPGQSGSITLYITSSSSSSAGSYTFTVRATDVYDSTHSSTASASYQVSCTRSNPSVSISTSSQTGSRGQTLTYTVTVKNNDDSSCGPSTFSLTFQSCPSGFTCKFVECLTEECDQYNLKDSLDVYIYPTQSKSVDIRITSSSTSSPGTYTFTVKATNQNAPSYYSTASANYNIPTTT